MPLHTEKCRRANKRSVCGLWSWLLWEEAGGERGRARERKRGERERTRVITFIWASEFFLLFFFITHLPGIFVPSASSELICDIESVRNCLSSIFHLPSIHTPSSYIVATLCGDLWQMWHVHWPQIYSVTTGLIHLSGHLSVWTATMSVEEDTKKFWLMHGKLLAI